MMRAAASSVNHKINFDALEILYLNSFIFSRREAKSLWVMKSVKMEWQKRQITRLRIRQNEICKYLLKLSQISAKTRLSSHSRWKVCQL